VLMAVSFLLAGLAVLPIRERRRPGSGEPAEAPTVEA
jgi:hypothetical protein